MNWNGKITFHVPCPWPHERVTITRKRYSTIGGSVRSDKRNCYGAENVYLLGIAKPNYPMPALRETVEILPDRVIMPTLPEAP